MLLFLVCFFCHAPSPERRAFEGCIVRTRIASPNYPTLQFQISRDSHHRLRSYCGETASLNYAIFFRAPCRKNYTLDRKMDHTFYDGHDELYHHAKFGEDRTTRAGYRCENVVFVFCCFFVTLRVRSAVRSRGA